MRSLLKRIARKFQKNSKSSQFNDYQEYVDIQRRCEPKEFMDSRIKVVTGLCFALNKLIEIGISRRINFEEGLAAGQLKEDRIEILDAGVRDGWTIEFLKSIGYPNAIGCELLPDYVEYAQSKGRNVVVGDLHKLPFENESFDFVHSRHTIEHCLDPIKVFSELFRVLRKGGALYCTFPLVAEPHGKHTLAFPNLKALKKTVYGLNWDFKEIYFGMSENTRVIPEGPEVMIFIQKNA